VKIKLLIIYLAFLLLPLINASGLNIIETSLELDKSYEVDKTFQITIRNEESFDFKNITFKEDWVKVTKFSLNSGENKTIIGKITRDTNFDGVITIIGDYYTDVGQSNQTTQVEIDYENSLLSPCNLNLVAGDSINWTNLHYDSIKIINSDSSGEIASINAGSSIKKTFNSQINFNYYCTWIGFQFTQICNVNVINSEGYVHNSNYDDTLNLKLNILLEETEITETFYEERYNISYGSYIEDVFKLKNTGDEIAQNITLSGSWFEFEENNFNLGIGNSKNIIFKVIPNLYSTNQTNKTYNKILKIEGNFETIYKNISIFVPYKNLDSIFSGEIDDDVIYNFFKKFCEEDYDACVGLFCAVYPEECQDGMLSGSNVTQSFSSSTLKGLLEGYAKLLEDNEKSKKTIIETQQTQINEIIRLGNESNKTSEEIKEIKTSLNNNSIAVIFSAIFTLFSLSFFVFILIYNKFSSNIIKKRLKFNKGEAL
jgi:plastocyanin